MDNSSLISTLFHGCSLEPISNGQMTSSGVNETLPSPSTWLPVQCHCNYCHCHPHSTFGRGQMGFAGFFPLCCGFSASPGLSNHLEEPEWICTTSSALEIKLPDVWGENLTFVSFSMRKFPRSSTKGSVGRRRQHSSLCPGWNSLFCSREIKRNSF